MRFKMCKVKVAFRNGTDCQEKNVILSKIYMKYSNTCK